MTVASRSRRWARTLVPWLIGLGVLALVVRRIDPSALRQAMSYGDHVALAAVCLIGTVAVLITDSFATQVGLRVNLLRWPFLDTLAIRGSTYMLALINFAVGQVGLGYALHRAGLTAKRVVGITLFLTGTGFAALLLITTLAWGLDARGGPLWWMLLLGCGGLLAYLGGVWLAPAGLARRELLAPLFDVGLRGYALAIAGRMPHVLALVQSLWVGMRAWGLEVPFAVGLTSIPAVVIVAALPISPGGIGTSHATMVFLFSAYATGASVVEREANVLAFGMVYVAYSALSYLIVGALCRVLYSVRERRGAFGSAASPG